MKNTKKRGILRFFIFKKKGDKKYTGVCIDLAIVEEGKDIKKLKASLEEAAKGYVEGVCKTNLPDSLLNQASNLPPKYLKLYNLYKKYTDLLPPKETKKEAEISGLVKRNLITSECESFTKSLNLLGTMPVCGVCR